jgi:PAS domain S-box-containing protein
MVEGGVGSVEWVRTLREGASAGASGGFDVALLDLGLPDSAGLETFTAFRAAAPELPVVILTGEAEEGAAVEAVRAGAEDYLWKPEVNGPLLLRALRYARERGRSNRAIQRQHEMLLALLDHIPDRIYFKDRASRFILVNRAMAEMHGRPAEELVGLTDFQLFRREHAEDAFRDERRIIATGEPVVAKVEKETLPDGRIDWVLTTKMPFLDRDGHVVGTFGISRVISEMKRMEEELASERNLLRSLIDNLPDPICLIGPDGAYRVGNLALAELLGAVDPAAVVGRRPSDFLRGPLGRKVELDDAAVIASGAVMAGIERRVPRGEGEAMVLSVTKVPMRGDAGEVSGVICIGRDVTAAKQAEARLVEANAQLFAALSDLQQSNDELRALQLQLIEAEKMKVIGRMAAGIAHEVKNPLAILDMGIRFLGEEVPADPTMLSVLKEMGEAVRRADGVIRDMLDFSAPRPLELAPADLNGILSRAAGLCRGELHAAQADVVLDLDPALPPVAVDPTKMSQVFVNLIINAAHAVGKGGTITVRTRLQQLTGVGVSMGDQRAAVFHPGDRVVVAEIADTGPGISPEVAERLFDPFFTTKSPGKGSGLGLTVSRSIVTLHGGTLEILNGPEGGATARVMIPAL